MASTLEKLPNLRVCHVSSARVPDTRNMMKPERTMSIVMYPELNLKSGAIFETPI